MFQIGLLQDMGFELLFNDGDVWFRLSSARSRVHEDCLRPGDHVADHVGANGALSDRVAGWTGE